jgi:vacuolar-type H+-ATPase subunit I/STV1
MNFTPDRTPTDMTQEMRAAMFKAWSDYLDQFMRSPDFLRMMQQSMNATLQSRKQWNDLTGQMQHGFQLATRQDVDQVLSSIHHAERRVIDRVEELAEQLENLESKIEAVEKAKKMRRAKKKRGEAPKKQRADD